MTGRTNLKTWIVISVFLFGIVSVSAGRTIYVADDGSADFNTIQAGIDDANTGDVVIVGEGTYFENINFGGKNIILCSIDPTNPSVVANTIIDGRQSGSVVTFSGTESASCVLSGFTITNGRGTYGRGGGIRGNSTLATIQYNVISGNKAGPSGFPGYGYGGGLYDCDGIIQYNEISWNQSIANELSADGGGLYGCDGTIRNNIISYNSLGGIGEGDGGGMYCKYGSPTVTNCTFSNNSATLCGGGIYSEGGRLTITNCTFISNSATDFVSGNYTRGGGIYSVGGTPTLTNCTFSGNSTHWGGGIYSNGGSLTITNCTFSNNLVEYYGGGIFSVGCNPTLTNCTFSGNSAQFFGGGMLNGGNATLTNCIFIGNSAEEGGGMRNAGGNLILTNCAFSQNSAAVSGGGMGSSGCSLTLTNCTFAGNSTTHGVALACDSFEQQYPSNVRFDNCILWDGGSEIWNNDNSMITITYSDVQGDWPGTGNLDIDPCFAQLAYWDPNGTHPDPNDDFWVDGDYHLKSQAGRWKPSSQSWVQDDVTSPCIDVGDPNSPIGLEPFPNGGRINMGAYGGTVEASKSYFGEPLCQTIVAGDINGDCRINFIDFQLIALHWLRDENP